MQITYLVGNGLDIQYGLKTRYKDFYDYQYEIYKERNNQNFSYKNYIYDELFKDKNRKNNYQNWSDFELAIGKLTKDNYIITCSPQNKEKFIEDFSEVIDDLRAYLKSEENSFKLKNAEVDFIQSVMELKDHIPPKQSEKLWQKFNKFPGYRDQINILTFNYTTVLDKLYKQSINESNRSFRNSNSGFKIGAAFHAHGTLDRYATLGVSDESQISSDFTEEEKESLIKRSILNGARVNNNERNRNIIESSDVIVIYGMSIGETDQYIWNIIAEHSVKNNIPIIIYYYDVDVNFGNPLTLNKKYKQVDNLFIERVNIDDTNKEKLKENIISIVGQEQIFKIIGE